VPLSRATVVYARCNMGSASRDREDAAELADEVRARLDVIMDGAAHVSEFTVDFPLQAHPPLTKEQSAVAVALNTVAKLLDRRAEEACRARDDSWRGLADAADIVTNEAVRLGVPQLFADVPADAS
jgi:hypothetical protein